MSDELDDDTDPAEELAIREAIITAHAKGRESALTQFYAAIGRQVAGQHFPAITKNFEESKHPRDHGKFSEKPGGKGETKTKEKPDKEEEENEPVPEWDGNIVASDVERNRGWHERNVASWDFYDDEGGHFPQVVALESGEYDPFPDHPDSEPVTVYRWVSYQDGDGYQSDHGEWTADEDKAREDGEEFASDSNQDEPEAEEEEDDEGEENDDEETDDDAKVWTELFGDDAPEPLDLCGIPDCRIDKVDASGEEYAFEAHGPKIESIDRTFKKNHNGDLVCHNDYFRVKPEYQGTGYGESVFAAQVKACADAGVAYIETHAAGFFGSPDFNGYYTWPTFGYDQRLDDRASTGPKFDKAREKFPDAESILDIMATPTVELSPEEFADAKSKLEELDRKLKKPAKERTSITGSEWWKINGTALKNAKFDLDPESRSMAILNARQKKPKGEVTKSYSALNKSKSAKMSGQKSKSTDSPKSRVASESLPEPSTNGHATAPLPEQALLLATLDHRISQLESGTTDDDGSSDVLDSLWGDPDALRAIVSPRSVRVEKGFDENEKRDASGKWSGTGGVGSGAADDRDLDDVLADDLGMDIDRSDVREISRLDGADFIRGLSAKPVEVKRVPISKITGHDADTEGDEIEDPDSVERIIIGYDGELIDGHHRLSGLKAGGQTHANAIIATPDDLKAADEFGGLQGRDSWSEEMWIKWMIARSTLSSPHGVGDAGEDVGEPRHLKAWSEQSHPRADDGRFVSASEIRSATRDPKKADALRASVTNPKEREKLDTQLDTAAPLAGKQRSDATRAHDLHQSLGKTSPDLHSEEGREHVDLARGHLVAMMKRGDVKGIVKSDEKFAHNAAVHWGEAKAKAIKQFSADYPGADLSTVRAAFDTALEHTKGGYEYLTGKAAEYAALAKKGGKNFAAHGASYRQEFEESVKQLKDTYEEQQNKVWDAIEATRDKLGGKAKGYKLGRYFKAWDESLHPRDKRGIWISRERIHEAKTNPALAAELREEVKPADAQKLDDALAGKSDTGRTAKGLKKDATTAKRTRQTASRSEAKRLATKLMLNQHAPDVQDLRDLAHHLQSGDLRVQELRDIRLKLGAKFGGGRKMADMLEKLQMHVAGKVNELDPHEKPKVIQKGKKSSDSILQLVQDYGGIDPNSHEFKTNYENTNRAVQDKIPLLAFRTGGRGLDQIARELETNGHISVPDDVHPGTHVLDLLRERAFSLHADFTKKYDEELNEYWKAQHEAESEHTPAEIESTVRSGSEVGRDEATQDPYGEHAQGVNAEPTRELEPWDEGYVAPVADTMPLDPYTNAIADHRHALIDIPPNESGYVGGHLVRRRADGSYQVETGKGYRVGTLDDMNDHIQEAWQKQTPEQKAVDKALDRAITHEDADPFSDPDGAHAEHERRQSIPEGARAVSLDAATRGRVGKVVRDPETGAARLVLDGGEETKASNFEPLAASHSWRTPFVKQEAAKRAVQGDLFADEPASESLPVPVPTSSSGMDKYTREKEKAAVADAKAKFKAESAAESPAVSSSPSREPAPASESLPGEDDRLTYPGKRGSGDVHHEGKPLRSGDLLVSRDRNTGKETLVDVAHAHHEWNAGGGLEGVVNVKTGIKPNTDGFKRAPNNVTLSDTRRATADDVNRLAAESGIEPPPEYLDPKRLADANTKANVLPSATLNPADRPKHSLLSAGRRAAIQPQPGEVLPTDAEDAGVSFPPRESLPLVAASAPATQPRKLRGPSDYAPPTEEEFAAASQPAPKPAPTTPTFRPLARLGRPGGGENSHEQMPEKPATPASESLPPESTGTAKLADGRTVSFVPHPVAKHGGRTTVMVDPAKLDAELAKDTNFHVPVGGGPNEIAGRRDNFKRFLESGKPIEQPEVSVHKGKIRLNDGRHRFSVLHEAGIDQIPVTVHAGKQADELQKRLGVTESGKSALDKPPLVGDTVPTAPTSGADASGGKTMQPDIARIEALDAEIAKHRNAINSAPPNAGKSRGIARRRMADAYKERDKLLAELGVKNPNQYLPSEWKSQVSAPSESLPPASEPAASPAPPPATESLPAVPTSSPSPLTGKQKERANSRIAELDTAIAGHESALSNGIATGLHAKDVKAKLRTAKNQREQWQAKLKGKSESAPSAPAATESLPPLTEPKAAPAHLNLNDPAALATAAHAAGKTLANFNDKPFDPAMPHYEVHKVPVADVYDKLHASNQLPPGTTLDAFKASMQSARTAGAIDLARSDLPQHLSDDQRARMQRSEMAHPMNPAATSHYLSVPSDQAKPAFVPYTPKKREPKPAQPPAALSPDALARDPGADRRTLAALAAQHAPDSKARDYLETAAHNLHQDDSDVPAIDRRRDTVKQLAETQRAAHNAGDAETAAHVAAALKHFGAEPHGPQPGKPTAFDGRYHESDHPAFTGDKVTVTRQPVVLPGAGGGGRDYVASKGKVAPVSNSGKSTLDKSTVVGNTTPSAAPTGGSEVKTKVEDKATEFAKKASENGAAFVYKNDGVYYLAVKQPDAPRGHRTLTAVGTDKTGMKYIKDRIAEYFEGK